ncbi:MAG TPA: hypothetical protein VFR78_20645 [Pyrinomonadaceae bacterium]|nr:hypothetical protein [Pyrinomonadaceae bacterium]
MSRLLKNRLLVSLLLLTVVTSAYAIFPVLAAPQDKPVLTEEQKKKVNAVNDQLRSAEQSIELAEGVRRSADSTATLIADRSSFDGANEISLRKLEELADAVRSVATLTLIASLDNAKSQLEKVKTDLTAARDALPAEANGLPEEIGVARKRATDEIARLTARSKAQDDAKAKLQKTLTAVPGKVKVLAELFPQRLSEIAAITSTADAKALIPALPNNMAAVVEVDGQRRILRTRWKELTAALAQAESENTQNNAAVDTAIDAIDTQVVDDVLKKLGPWFGTLETHAKDETAKAAAILPSLIQDPVMNSPAALTLVSSGSALHDDLLRVGDGWIKLSAQLKGITISGFDLKKTSQAAQALADVDTNLNTTLVVLQDGLTGDASRFVADQVSLYYFTDVERIMKMLNKATYEIGGVKDARERASLERQRLTTTELDLAEAAAQVSKAQQSVKALEEELRQSKAAFSSATDVLRKASRNLKSVQDDHSRNEERYNQAKTAFDANPADPEKRLAFDRASEERDRSAARLLASEQRNEDATRDRDAAKERNDVASNEQAGLPARIQQARDQLEIAQSAVTRQRRAAFLAAQAESEAFAFARDNRPFWFAPAIASTRDPVHRVLMYAFSDSKTIFLRGNRPDVDVAKDIIAKFDRPAPQARLTLWTMEMSSDTSPKGTERFNEALIRIEEELANNRALTSAAISFLRHCLNEEVNSVADAESKRFSSDRNLSRMNEENRFRLARLRFYHPEVLSRLGFAEATFEGRSQDEMRQLIKLAEFALPDPSGTTTLGEALMVLSLGKRVSRANVISNFRNHLKAQLTKLNLTDSNDANEPSWKTDSLFFTSTARVLGLDMDSAGTYDGFTAAQEEIVRALERIFLERVIAEIRSANATLQEIERDQRNPQTPAVLRLQLEARRRNVVRSAIPLINVARTRFSVGSVELLSNNTEIGKNVEELGGFTQGARVETDPRRNENARIAAADQMLKEMIIAVEDDIERHFVQRMLNRLRRKITRDQMGIGVGVMQRTSMLATNRLLARVDPRASAQLAVGEEQNILQSIQQLAQIYLTTQTGGALGLLGALDRQPREAPPEIYGINTGNVFQVTPIFDPSGQALRFKLDFVGITRIQEPSGTVSRQLPRIERHTVNTEVQLSNLEIREVSRFESNTRIGRPTEYSGGLPIIKDIPKVRPYLPLLGWFVRKGGKAAVVQQSLIFGQTTMYPTILDIMDLLTPPTISR